MNTIPIIIPSYEPDERLLTLLQNLNENRLFPVILINDGSGAKYNSIFEKAEILIKDNGGLLLSHSINQGKGRALKTAFTYVLNNIDDALGVITADSDGQHTAKSINNIKNELEAKPDSLILGVRTFNTHDIPWKSKFGNTLTERIFKYITGVHITDTQTGLRGIPREFMKTTLSLKGERFELEMRMLIEAAGTIPIVEIPIETIYDSKDNHQTHFNPIKDSFRIYRILGERFLRFLFSGVSSSILDLLLFMLGCVLLKTRYPFIYAGIATVIARIFSAVYNYAVNYLFVFKSRQNPLQAGFKYAMLAIIQMCCSAGLIVFFIKLFPLVPELILKVIIDITLFFISYKIQQSLIFKK